MKGLVGRLIILPHHLGQTVCPLPRALRQALGQTFFEILNDPVSHRQRIGIEPYFDSVHDILLIQQALYSAGPLTASVRADDHRAGTEPTEHLAQSRGNDFRSFVLNDSR
eukprot:6664989-Karenia_brevis.AAC.1